MKGWRFSVGGADGVRFALVAALILVLPFATRKLLLVDVHTPQFQVGLLGVTTVGPLDLILVVIAAAAVPVVFRRSTYRPLPIGLVGAVGFTAVTALWLLLDPSPEGVMRCARFAGITGAVAIVSTMPRSVFRLAVIWPLTLAAASQAILGILQTFYWQNGHTNGITSRWGDAWTQGFGTMHGGYPLAAFLVLSIAIILGSEAFERLHPIMWASVAVSSFAIAVTFGRQGVLSTLMMGSLFAIGWAITRSRYYLTAAISSTIPMLAGIGITWSGWSVRATETASLNSSGRTPLIRRAMEIISDHPLVGVGPGNYGATLVRMGVADDTLVHNVPALVAAEYGVPVAVLFGVWFVVLGFAAFRTSLWAGALFVSILPYLAFDHPHLAYAYGIAELGLWLAVLDFHRRCRVGRTPQPGHHVTIDDRIDASTPA